MNELKYKATKTADKFHTSKSFVKLLFGCVGSGKSVACLIDLFINAANQEPSDDGIRRSRYAIIRNTYPELVSTTIKTWQAWFPEEIFGKIKYTSPITHRFKVNDIDSEIYFLALDTPADIRKLKSLELTGAYINEAQFCDESIFLTCQERVNRYPSKKDGVGATNPYVILDANPPSTHHWIFDTFERNKPDNYEIFKYPPAIIVANDNQLKQLSLTQDIEYAISKDGTKYINNPMADFINVQADKNYWLNLVPGNKDDKIKVDFMGEFGVVVTGRPVHSTYNDTMHYSNNVIPYNPNLILRLGWDFGLTPACAVTQLTATGRYVVIEEFWSKRMGLRDFAKNVVLPGLDLFCPGWKNNYVSVHDPAGSTGSQTDNVNCEQILADEEIGIKSSPAPGNNSPDPRRDGLDYFLGRMTDGFPAFSVSSKCQMIREGLKGLFQYALIQSGGERRYHEKPLKNIYSHICEALEYIAMFSASGHKKPVASSVKPNIIQRGTFMAF